MQSINTSNIPEELKARKSWVLWKYIIRRGEKAKVLYQANGSEAKSNDPSTWETFGVIKQRFAAGNWEGIGYVFSPEDPYTGIDLDGCRNVETGVIEQWAKDIILQLGSYAELSPSLSGVKIWVRANWPVDGGHKVAVPDAAQVSEKTPGIEVYDWGRFFTVTGKRLTGLVDVVDCQEAVDALRAKYWKPKTVRNSEPSDFRSPTNILDRARKYIATIDPAISGQDGHGKTFYTACVLVKGFALPEEDALGLLREWNQHCQPPWSERELLHKVTQAGQQNGETGYLCNVTPDNYSRVPMPNYSPPTSKVTQHSPSQHSAELPLDDSGVRETILEHATREIHREYIEGRAKLFDLGLPDLDYSIGGGVEPGEMIIFAGRPNHGKSMAAQQASYTATANGIPVLFVSEEMPARSFGKRLIHFATEIPAESWGVRAEAVEAEIDSHFKNRAPTYILEGCRTAEMVASQVRKYVKEKGVGLVIVDYAQKLTAGIGNQGGRYNEITKVSMALKNVLAECMVPGIVLCQMSRAIENRPEFVPIMSDLKESGQLEQDADVIVFQVWPHKIDSGRPANEYLFYVAKNRNRETNQPVVRCKFEPSRQRLVHMRAPLDDIPTFGDGGVPDVFSDANIDGNF